MLCTNYDECATCGWNPKIEAQRKDLLRLIGRDALQNKEDDFDDDQYAMRYILRNLKEYGGEMSREEIQATLMIGDNTYSEEKQKAKDVVKKMVEAMYH